MRKQNAYTLKRFKAAFAKMMETTSIPTNMSSVDSINLYSNIFSFVEPNIPKFRLTDEWLEEIRKSIPELAFDRKNRYMNEYGKLYFF